MQLQLKIQLQHISKPPVWRKVLVPDSFSFHKLHLVIQEAFDWSDFHLYQFSPSGYGSYPLIGIPDDSGWGDIDEDEIDSKKIKLSAIFKTRGQKFTYIYDFGDDWVHKIILEELLPGNGKKASLLSGKGACPPEDCGGPSGYEEMLKVLGSPQHEEYHDLRIWLGLLEEDDVWDTKYFDLETAQELVSEI